MLRKIIVGAIAVGAMGFSATSAKAAVVKKIVYGNPSYLIFGETIEDEGYDYSFGFDDSLDNGKSFNTSYSTDAKNNFISSLVNPTTQDFNSFASGEVTSLPLNFGDAGTADFKGKGVLSKNNNFYPQNNSQILEIGNRTDYEFVPGSTFNEFDFSKPISAIGFSIYPGTDSAWSPTNLELTKLDGTTKQISFPAQSYNGLPEKVYFDVTAQNLSEQFSKIRFLGESSRIQGFALEGITAAGFDQVKKPTPVPEPTTILGSSMAIAFGVVLRRKFKK